MKFNFDPTLQNTWVQGGLLPGHAADARRGPRGRQGRQDRRPSPDATTPSGSRPWTTWRSNYHDADGNPLSRSASTSPSGTSSDTRRRTSTARSTATTPRARRSTTGVPRGSTCRTSSTAHRGELRRPVQRPDRRLVRPFGRCRTDLPAVGAGRPEPEAEDDRSGAVAVVAAALVDLHEAPGGVEGQRTRVVLAHLEQQPVGAALPGGADHGLQEGGRQAGTAVRRVDRDALESAMSATTLTTAWPRPRRRPGRRRGSRRSAGCRPAPRRPAPGTRRRRPGCRARARRPPRRPPRSPAGRSRHPFRRVQGVGVGRRR